MEFRVIEASVLVIKKLIDRQSLGIAVARMQQEVTAIAGACLLSPSSGSTAAAELTPSDMPPAEELSQELALSGQPSGKSGSDALVQKWMSDLLLSAKYVDNGTATGCVQVCLCTRRL